MADLGEQGMTRRTAILAGLSCLATGGRTMTGIAAESADAVVMIHGAFAGGWCFENFRPVFEASGWRVHTPDLRGHGDHATSDRTLDGLGLAEYLADLAAFIATLPHPPVLLGHSMGAVLAQQLAAAGLARALVLLSPAPRAGLLPHSDDERRAAQGLMSLGPFWTGTLPPNFEVAAQDSLNRIPLARQRAVFDRFGPESGRALFELFFWMLDGTAASAVDTEAVRCPVLCLSGHEDRVVSMATARATAAAFPGALMLDLPDHGHMAPVEPGAEEIARTIASWCTAVRMSPA